VGLEWVWGLLQPGFVRWAPPSCFTKPLLRSHPSTHNLLLFWFVFIRHVSPEGSDWDQEVEPLQVAGFYRPDILPVAQPTVSKHWRDYVPNQSQRLITSSLSKMTSIQWSTQFKRNPSEAPAYTQTNATCHITHVTEELTKQTYAKRRTLRAANTPRVKKTTGLELFFFCNNFVN